MEFVAISTDGPFYRTVITIHSFSNLYPKPLFTRVQSQTIVKIVSLNFHSDSMAKVSYCTDLSVLSVEKQCLVYQQLIWSGKHILLKQFSTKIQEAVWKLSDIPTGSKLNQYNG